jgi:hypothetical protein
MYIFHGSVILGSSLMAIGILMAMCSTSNAGDDLFGRGMKVAFCGFFILILTFAMVWLMIDKGDCEM